MIMAVRGRKRFNVMIHPPAAALALQRTPGCAFRRNDGRPRRQRFSQVMAKFSFKVGSTAISASPATDFSYAPSTPRKGFEARKGEPRQSIPRGATLDGGQQGSPPGVVTGHGLDAVIMNPVSLRRQ